MKQSNFKTLDHLNKKITVLGYPPFGFILIFLVLFMCNIFGFFVFRVPVLKVIALGVDVFFIVFTYHNYKRLKNRQLPLYITAFTPKKKFVSTDKSQVLNIIYKNEGN